MKHVKKRQPPPSFEEWKAKANANWTPTYDNLQNPQKSELHLALLCEQGWVCCYCGRTISEFESHIEHFRPQRQVEMALNYENLHASCIRDRSRGMPLHCGPAKGEAFDEGLHISPLESGCEERFLYTLGGEVSPTHRFDKRAAYMLDLLKLNISFLRNRRKAALERVFDTQFLDSMTTEELKRLRDSFRSLDSQGRAQDFGHVVARFAEQRLAD